MTTYYSEGQFSVVYPFLEGKTPRWLILAGPSDGNEAQCAVEKWPDIRVIGLEPNPEALAWQVVNGWPYGHVLLPHALSNCQGKADFVYEAGKGTRNGSMDSLAVEGNRTNSDARVIQVNTITLDYLDSLYGPFLDTIVWMDIEGSELLALQGASNLISRRAVLLWNIEMQNRVPGLMEGVPALLTPHSYKQVHEWNASDTCRDRIYILD